MSSVGVFDNRNFEFQIGTIIVSRPYSKIDLIISQASIGIQTKYRGLIALYSPQRNMFVEERYFFFNFRNLLIRFRDVFDEDDLVVAYRSIGYPDFQLAIEVFQL